MVMVRKKALLTECFGVKFRAPRPYVAVAEIRSALR